MSGILAPSPTGPRYFITADHVDEPESHLRGSKLPFSATMDYVAELYTPSARPVRVYRQLVADLCRFSFTGRLPDGLLERFNERCYAFFDSHHAQLDKDGLKFTLFSDESELNIFLSAFADIAESVADDYRLNHHWHWMVRLVEYAVRDCNYDGMTVASKRALFRSLYDQAVQDNANKVHPDETFTTMQEWNKRVEEFCFADFTAASVAKHFAEWLGYDVFTWDEDESEDESDDEPEDGPLTPPPQYI